jgi:light-regulated signal transduction histidine kinase (bacteriophytochrome)
MSAETEKSFGYTREELEGQPLSLLLHEGSLEEEETAGAEAERVGRRKSGAEFPVEVRASQVETQHGAWVVNALRDITARKRAAQALTMANRELESFSYSVAHDLRAPLRSIQGFSQALLEDSVNELGEAGRDHLGRVMAAAERMGQLIDSMLALSRVSRVGITSSAVDLSLVAEGVVAQLRASEPNRLVDFVCAEAPMLARGDPALLRVLLENLIGNAWKFTGKRERGRIELGVTRIGQERAYFVRDDGVGFDMAFTAKLFSPFQRLHTTQEFPGTGVGLATVQRIVRRHGGRIWAEARVNHGATFYFTLPHEDEGT